MREIPGKGPLHPGGMPVVCGWLAVLLSLAAAGGAQEVGEPLITDRPDFTESSNSVEKNRVQLESGLTYDEVVAERGWSLGEILLRIGISERVELRFGINSWLQRQTSAGDLEGWESPSLGAKLELAPGGEGSPLGGASMALIVEVGLPAGSTDLAGENFDPGLIWIAAWDLSDTLALGINLGYGLESLASEQFSVGSASAALGIGLTDRWGTYVELFAILPESELGEEATFFDAGVTYLVSNDLQFDLRAGHGLNGDDPDFFVGAGFAARW